MAQTDAETAISQAGLTTGTVTQQYSDTVPEGDVISQSPEAGTEVECGSTVDLVVSQGPEPNGCFGGATVPPAKPPMSGDGAVLVIVAAALLFAGSGRKVFVTTPRLVP